MDKLPKNILIYILSLSFNNKVFLVCKKWNEIMSDVLYIFNKNNPGIYELEIEDINDFKSLMNIKTLEDIGEKYNINQIFFVLTLKKNNNLLSKYVEFLLKNYDKEIIKQNYILINYIVKHECMHIIKLLFDNILCNNDIILIIIVHYESENILKYFSELDISCTLKIYRCSAYLRKINFIKKNMKPEYKDILIDDFKLLLKSNNIDKSTYSDVFEFLNNL